MVLCEAGLQRNRLACNTFNLLSFLWEAVSRSGFYGEHSLAVDQVVAAEDVAKAAAEDATASRTKTIANLSGSHANRAGSLHPCMS
jgi:hypothetical protein